MKDMELVERNHLIKYQNKPMAPKKVDPMENFGKICIPTPRIPPVK